MIIRALDSDHDFQFGKGIQSYLRGSQAIGLNVKTRLLSFLNDCFFDSQTGIDWVRLLGTRSTEQEIVLNCRGVVLQSEGVVKVNTLEALLARTTRRMVITYNIDTIFSRRFSDSLEVG